MARCAQRRPESEPRRHSTIGASQGSSRSTLNEGRSLNPGDTSGRAWTPATWAGSLNEGRSLNPGDTHLIAGIVDEQEVRSTKAGV